MSAYLEYANFRKQLLGKHYRNGAGQVCFHINLGKKLLDLYSYLSPLRKIDPVSFESVLIKARSRYLDWKTGNTITLGNGTYIGNDPEVGLANLNRELVLKIFVPINRVYVASRCPEIETYLWREFRAACPTCEDLAFEFVNRFEIIDIAPYYKEALFRSPNLAAFILREFPEQLQKYINLA